MQGTFHRQQLFVGELLKGSVLELDRASGWQVEQCQPGPAFATNILHAVWSLGWIKSTTFHIRVLLVTSNGERAQVSDVPSQLPYCFEFLYRAKVVVEMSPFPSKWPNRMKLLAEELAG